MINTATHCELHLTSQWFIKPGYRDAVLTAVEALAHDVLEQEPGTLTYLVHTPAESPGAPQSLPPTDGNSLMFFERYRDRDAFDAHVKGELFTNFVKTYGALFILNSQDQPYTTVMFLQQQAGFSRG